MAPIIDQPRRALLLAMLSVAAAFVLVIGGGFLLAGTGARTAMNGTLGVVSGVALVAAAFVIARLLGIPTGRRTATVRQTVSAEPQHLPPNPQVSRELALAYANDPNMTITCPHLQPFERAMRAAAIPVIPGGKSIVAANCRIHRRGLEGPFTLPESVVYREYFLAERHQEDIPMARLQCTPCGSWITVLHPVECHLSTPWFPAPPAPMVLTAEYSFASWPEVTAIACSPRGQFIAVAAGSEFLIFDSAQSKPVQRLPAHGGIRSIAWIDEENLVTGQGVPWFRGFYGGQGVAGPSIFVWNAATGTELLRFGSDLFGVRGIAVSPDGRTLLASGRLGKTDEGGSSLDLWEISSGRLLARLARVDPPAHEMLPFFTGVAFTPDGSIALAACDRYTAPARLRPRERVELPAWWHRGVRAFRLSDGQELDLARLYNPVRAISVSQDGTRLMFYGARFGMWDLTNGSLIWDRGNGYEIGIAASSDCRLVARGTGYRAEEHSPYVDTAVELYDGGNGELLSVATHEVPPTAIAFSSDRSLAAGGEGGKIRFWHLPPSG
jgi:WD40 repeat protein